MNENDFVDEGGGCALVFFILVILLILVGVIKNVM